MADEHVITNLSDCIDEAKLRVPVTIEVGVMTLLAVHGALALALRHPGMAHRPSTKVIAAFAKQSLQAVLDAGVFTREGLQILARELYENDPSVVPESLLV